MHANMVHAIRGALRRFWCGEAREGFGRVEQGSNCEGVPRAKARSGRQPIRPSTQTTYSTEWQLMCCDPH